MKVFWVLGLFLVGALGAWGTASAEPQLKAVPGPNPDSWIVSGSGFEPHQALYVNQIPCGVLPCGAGAMVGVQEPTADTEGKFVVSMQLLVDFVPHPGQTDRLIAAYGKGWTQDQVDHAPGVRVVLHHQGSPGPPATGSGAGEATSLPLVAVIVAALGIAALSATSLVRSRLRRS